MQKVRGSVTAAAAAVLFGLAAAAASASSGAVFFVSPTGNDSGPGTRAEPWRTIGKAAATLTAGQTVQLRSGRYREHVLPTHSGGPTAPIRYEAYPGERPVIDGSGVTLVKDEGLFQLQGLSSIQISGLRIEGSPQAGILADGCDHLVVSGCSTERTGSSGIGVWGCRDVVIEGNDVALSCSGPWQEGITVAGTRGFVVRGNTVHNGPAIHRKEGICIKDGSADGSVTGNVVHDVQAVGIYIDAWDKPTGSIEVSCNLVRDVLGYDGIALASEMGGELAEVRVCNNVVWRSRCCGITVTSNGDATAHPIRGVLIVNNTVVASGTGGWGGGIGIDDEGASAVVVRNNICSGNRSFGIAVGRTPAAEVVIDHNLVDGPCDEPSARSGDDVVTGDPRFADGAKGDFRLRPGSPAVDAGSLLGAPAADFAGARRPSAGGIDIGAFER